GEVSGIVCEVPLHGGSRRCHGGSSVLCLGSETGIRRYRETVYGYFSGSGDHGGNKTAVQRSGRLVNQSSRDSKSRRVIRYENKSSENVWQKRYQTGGIRTSSD